MKGKETETIEQAEAAKKVAKKARTAFEKVKAARLQRFQDFFNPVSQKIDEIYKVWCLAVIDGSHFLMPSQFSS